jgi:NitT/TauT family transport system permease protein
VGRATEISLREILLTKAFAACAPPVGAVGVAVPSHDESRPTAVAREKPRFWIDLLVLGGFVALFFSVAQVTSGMAPSPEGPDPDRPVAVRLPKYALFSFARGWIAYFFSLVFTLLVASWAFYDVRAHRYILPALDILQSIPVLGFLPALFLALVALFPHSNTGLELACILAIFTGQVWNMVFSYYDSLRGIPGDFRMLGKLYNFNWWQRFWRVELPFGAQGLLYNSMVSMAADGFSSASPRPPLPSTGCRAARPGPGLLHQGGHRQGRHPRKDLRRSSRWGSSSSSSTGSSGGPSSSGRASSSWTTSAAAGRQRIRSSSGSPGRCPSRRWRRSGRSLQRCGCSAPASADGGDVPRRAGRARSRSEQVGAGHLFVLLWAWWPCSPGGRPELFLLLRPVGSADWSEILADTGYSFLRVLAAVLIGTLWTVPLGVWIGLNPEACPAAPALHPVRRLLPAPMLYPWLVGLVLFLHGTLQWGAVLLILFGTQWYILFNVAASAAAIPNDIISCAEILHLSGWSRWTKFLLPAILPGLVTGWITAAGGAWNATIVSEIVQIGATTYNATGLGAYIRQGERRQ